MAKQGTGQGISAVEEYTRPCCYTKSMTVLLKNLVHVLQTADIHPVLGIVLNIS